MIYGDFKTDKHMTEISSLGEFKLIEQLTKQVELKNPSSVKVSVTMPLWSILMGNKYF